MPLRQLRTGTGKAAAATVTFMLVALTACGDDGDSASPAGGRDTVTVAALPLIDCAALYIARDRGLFEKEGLDVRVQQVQQSLQALPALAKGQIDMVASANYVTYLQAYEQGTLDVRIVAEAIRAAPRMMEVLVPEDSDIKTVADLEGKKLAVNTLNNVQSLTFDEILEKQGVGRPVYRAIPFPQMGAALDKGQVDAVHAVEPYDTSLQDELKARVLIDGSSAPVEALPLSGYISSSDYAEGNAKTLAAFQRAIRAAVRIAEKDPSVVRDILPTYTKVTEKQAESIDLPVFPPTMDAAQLTRLTDLMEKQGMLKKPIDPATLMVK